MEGEYIENDEYNDRLTNLNELLQSKSFDSLFQYLQKKTGKQLRHEVSNLLNKNYHNKHKNEQYSDLSRKLKKKFLDKDLSTYFFNFILASYLEKNVDYQPEEIINEISCVCNIKKTLYFYHNISFKEFLKRNLKLEKEFVISNKHKHYYFYFKSILDFESINYFKLKHLMEGPLQLRRPVDREHGFYRYIPILCKDYCEDNFIIFYENLTKEQKEHLEDNNQELYYEVKNLFLKNCIFAHNYNEINYHPFKFMTKFCKNKKCTGDLEDCFYAHKKEDFVCNFIINQFSDLLNELKVILKKKNGNLINREIHSQMIKNFSGFNIFEYKISICKKGQLCTDLKNCNFFHNLLERRRDPNKHFITFNKPCEKIFIEGKWTDPMKCDKGEECDYFHTRNELFYDIRNFRKIYECPYEKSDKECSNYFTCCYKHSLDISFNELYLPEKKRVEIKELMIQYKAYTSEIQKLKTKIEEYKLECQNCKNFIMDKMIVLKCGHNCCEKCISKMNVCPYKCIEKKNLFKVDEDYDVIELQKKEEYLCESVLLDQEDLELNKYCDFYNFSDDDDSFINL